MNCLFIPASPFSFVERNLSESARLLTDVELFDDCAVAFDVDLNEVVEHTAAFSDEHAQSAFCVMIFVI